MLDEKGENICEAVFRLDTGLLMEMMGLDERVQSRNED